jgi:hypothetical protein
MSPARLLAYSLTSCETRDEWVREYPDTYGFGHKTVYRNEKRDLTVTRGYTYGISLYGGSSSFLGTPFTLSKDEEKIVCEALDAFNRRKKDEAEAAALHRLTAQGIDAQRAETVKQGSVRSTKARSRSDAPKGRRATQSQSGDSPCQEG